ncbi:MAG: outer membrane protein assembly factor BamD [Holosporaceae bacterium]|jgi:outer membrane protein assembly factor BamD|nr:outer membrane protein assembly factor BamD [Holosporaceae bacterium]
MFCRRYFGLFLSFLLVGCAAEKEPLKNRSVDGIYKKAHALLKAGEYTDAASEFNDVDSLFPYSSKASEAQVLTAYCHFLASSYPDAIREIDVFLRYHPSHPLVPYAMYLKAICIYMRVASVGRDSQLALDAKEAFTELLNKFPESIYRADCVKRVMILDNLLAAHEMAIGRFYQRDKNALSAIGRYNFVVNKLPNTEHVSEAYYRIIECCLFIGLMEEAKNTYDVMKLAHGKSKWTKKADGLMKNCSKSVAGRSVCDLRNF